mmetsp:Transcript_5368/g.12930  ORF Transcript_5368/g.12930 Transcript_5368/m.12930 type:complete len:96 (-) Transcript_5368:502-789(-)
MSPHSKRHVRLPGPRAAFEALSRLLPRPVLAVLLAPDPAALFAPDPSPTTPPHSSHPNPAHSTGLYDRLIISSRITAPTELEAPQQRENRGVGFF